MTHPFTGDRIVLRDLGFYGYHGLFAEEEKLGQRFIIDLECGVDLTAPGESDAIGHTVSYADIYDLVKATFEKRTKLIEALGQNVVSALFERFSDIDWIIIRIRKPEAPIAMVRGEAAIELHRVRPN
ncbi:dihydroneopterin aldolase [Devosia sp. BK]|uniref:dihydroneopterin aldolase n=1 Tax=Devosia sp. BK TaxID=2871706 RepID=UPI00293A74BE|nr:dihydroneopterin aldolase [Devosia sp. BK]MDV3250943.1 dihydroneopterin aldolase [Devosia sp. BK]